MPRKNTERIYLEDSYYHVYNRGVNKQPIFIDQQDYAVFLNLFKRYLSREPIKDRSGREYPCLHKEIDLLAFCLMSNHFHALVYQRPRNAITRLFGPLTTSYGMYFNKKYRRVGPVFQSRFKTSLINKDAYLEHTSRYIHLNPKDYKKYEFSSLPYYLDRKTAEWIKPEVILDMFKSKAEYEKFLGDYEDYKNTLDDIKSRLAST